MPPPHDLFFRLFDSSPNPYLILDRDLNIATANRAYLASTKRELSDIVGRWAWDAYPTDPDTLAQAIASFKRVIRTGEVDTMALLRFDIPRPAAEGGGFETRYWSITHTPIFGADGAVEFVMQHPIDVTELERLRSDVRHMHDEPLALAPAQSGIFSRAQQVYETNLTLRDDIDRLNTLFRQAPSFMAVVRGPDYVYELVNDATVKLLGGRDVLGKRVRDVLVETERIDFIEILDQVAASGAPVLMMAKHVRVQDGDGALVDRVIDVVYQPMLDRDGKTEGIFIAGNDMTEQHRAHDTIQANLRSDARQKDEFLAMLGHELRNPLAPISAAADLLRLGAANPKVVHKAGTIIRRQVDHLRGLVDDLLDVSRVTRGLVDIAHARVDLKAAIAHALEQTEPQFAAKRQQVRTALIGAPVFVLGDDKRLVQIVTNLLTNAAKYTPEGGHIDVVLERAATDLVLVIRDDGIGMTEAMLQSAFNLFVQASRSADRTQGGLGIGLALVKSLVELHGGGVAIDSAGLGRGTTVTLSLPEYVAP